MRKGLLQQAGTPEKLYTRPRNLFVADRASEATIVESYVGLADDTYLTNAVTEVVLDEGALLQHYKIEQESERAFHVGTTAVVQGRDSTFTSGSIAVGGALARNNLGVRLAAPGASCALTGLYVLHGRQHVDNHTFIDHAAPRCTSRQLYKGVLDGRARGVFNGRVTVRRDDEIDVPLNECALGSNSAKEVGQTRGQGKPGRGGGPTSDWWSE